MPTDIVFDWIQFSGLHGGVRVGEYEDIPKTTRTGWTLATFGQICAAPRLHLCSPIHTDGRESVRGDGVVTQSSHAQAVDMENEIEASTFDPIPWVEHVMGALVKLPAGPKADARGKGRR
jgi:hypothetical protein